MRADNDDMDGNLVESCKDKSKPHKNKVCELFYDTRSGHEWDKENDKALQRHSCGDSHEVRKKTGDNHVFCMDKNVTACDLPEILVCYKESTYHVVKDICVDEGVPVHEKFLFGEKDSVRCNSNSNQCGAGDSELCNDPKTNQDVEVSSKEEFADAESSSYCNQEYMVVTREAKDSPTHGLNPSKVSHEVESDEKSKDQVTTSENEQRPLNNNSNSHRLEEQSPSKLQENEQRIETTAPKTEEPRKTEEMLSSVSTTTSQEPNKASNEPETDHQRPNMLVGDSLGETSFSAAESVSISGHISYSGPVAVSGRLSVRSDASTTSGRSFAFPILQSEWNTSPERMAKAEKRRLKGWRDILLCCRFS